MLNNTLDPKKTAEDILKKTEEPEIAIILGSGLGPLSKQVQDPTIIPYKDIPGFPVSKVKGHAGELIFGEIMGKKVVCMNGRTHMYEGVRPEHARFPIRVLKEIGCKSLIVTNAAGSIMDNVGPGELMLIKDHINLSGQNPLVGDHDPRYGERFPSMKEAYDLEYRKAFLKIAEREKIAVHKGVYAFVLGPNIETAAEIKMLRIIGAQAVGMSTAPEVIVARQCEMRILGVSVITNFAEGISDTPIEHDKVLHYGNQASKKLSKLITKFIDQI